MGHTRRDFLHVVADHDGHRRQWIRDQSGQTRQQGLTGPQIEPGRRFVHQQ